jgi:hypothetical protein
MNSITEAIGEIKVPSRGIVFLKLGGGWFSKIPASRWIIDIFVKIFDQNDTLT